LVPRNPRFHDNFKAYNFVVPVHSQQGFTGATSASKPRSSHRGPATASTTLPTSGSFEQSSTAIAARKSAAEFAALRSEHVGSIPSGSRGSPALAGVPGLAAVVQESAPTPSVASTRRPIVVRSPLRPPVSSEKESPSTRLSLQATEASPIQAGSGDRSVMVPPPLPIGIQVSTRALCRRQNGAVSHSRLHDTVAGG